MGFLVLSIRGLPWGDLDEEVQGRSMAWTKSRMKRSPLMCLASWTFFIPLFLFHSISWNFCVCSWEEEKKGTEHSILVNFPWNTFKIFLWEHKDGKMQPCLQRWEVLKQACWLKKTINSCKQPEKIIWYLDFFSRFSDSSFRPQEKNPYKNLIDLHFQILIPEVI